MRFPIRIRLAFAYCAVFLVVIAALEITAYISVRAAIHSIVDHELETRLAGLDDYLTRHIKVYPGRQLGEALKIHPAFQPDLLRIQTEDGVLKLNGNAFHRLSLPPFSPTVSILTTGDAGRMLRILMVSRRIDGTIYHLAMATDLLFSAKILGRLWLLMVVSLPLVLLIAGAAGYWISGRAIAPVSDIIAAARSMDSSRLSERIAVPPTGDEIQQLAETMNGMLARIEDGFQRIRQFNANASHELRTPLAIIRANAEVALLDRADKSGRSARDALRRILKEAERDTVLLEDMLQLARADAPIERMPRKLIDLRASLAAACADVRPLAEARGLELRVTSVDAACPSEGDEEQLRRLWLILLDNAVKYTARGGSILACAATTADGRPFVAVMDTGIGIAREHHARIFEPFYRVDKARSRDEGGAGLGLALARHIATAHSAVFDLESELGRGSRFCVTLPAVPRRAVSEQSATPEVIFR
jgi:two-component system, OmpR family, heavy metal sensor histidine kinase CusS